MKNNILHEEDELLDLVDSQDRVIGQKLRSAVHAEGLTNFRFVGGMVVNGSGKLWIPRRTYHKKLLPGHLATSMGGHVTAGESYLVAFARELDEELFLKTSEVFYRPLGLLTPHEHHISAFTMMYELQVDDMFDWNRDDFCEAYWLTPQEYFDRLACGEKSGDILKKVIELFYI